MGKVETIPGTVTTGEKALAMIETSNALLT
jgi:hypothetical protein